MLEIIFLDNKSEERVDFVEVVEYAEEVAWVAVGGDGEEIAEGRRQERGELLFGEEFEEGGFECVNVGLEGRYVLHRGGPTECSSVGSLRLCAHRA